MFQIRCQPHLEVRVHRLQEEFVEPIIRRIVDDVLNGLPATRSIENPTIDCLDAHPVEFLHKDIAVHSPSIVHVFFHVLVVGRCRTDNGATRFPYIHRVGIEEERLEDLIRIRNRSIEIRQDVHIREVMFDLHVGRSPHILRDVVFQDEEVQRIDGTTVPVLLQIDIRGLPEIPGIGGHIPDVFRSYVTIGQLPRDIDNGRGDGPEILVGTILDLQQRRQFSILQNGLVRCLKFVDRLMEGLVFSHAMFLQKGIVFVPDRQCLFTNFLQVVVELRHGGIRYDGEPEELQHVR